MLPCRSSAAAASPAERGEEGDLWMISVDTCEEQASKGRDKPAPSVPTCLLHSCTRAAHRLSGTQGSTGLCNGGHCPPPHRVDCSQRLEGAHLRSQDGQREAPAGRTNVGPSTLETEKQTESVTMFLTQFCLEIRMQDAQDPASGKRLMLRRFFKSSNEKVQESSATRKADKRQHDFLTAFQEPYPGLAMRQGGHPERALPQPSGHLGASQMEEGAAGRAARDNQGKRQEDAARPGLVVGERRAEEVTLQVDFVAGGGPGHGRGGWRALPSLVVLRG
ncbi:unnamed protein product [Rangifer tarandus platyrhynchus]|uniref:Uncharacterized protein n=2 Tax=Rangifer tarandus platyrhynchus TaxID=3082113 RepID=A0ACB0FGD5_RANTA|nr:unnamed protein product [Rangifer tarandus platyrhynchus]CAI9711076.1 unnamed protein product [Rangifer tarandus platyrhynchus]